MSSPKDESSTRPVAVPMGSSPSPSPSSASITTRDRGRSSFVGSPRHASIARLASPVPSTQLSGTPTIRQVPTPQQADSTNASVTPLAGASNQNPGSLPGPGASALAAALSSSIDAGNAPPKFGTPPAPLRPLSPSTAGAALNQQQQHQSPFGSYTRSIQGTHGYTAPNALEDPEIVRRHLVLPFENEGQNDGEASIFSGPKGDGKSQKDGETGGYNPGLNDDEFSSLRLQGGDVTRPIYRWAEQAQADAMDRGRSKSFNLGPRTAEDETLDIGSIKLPGGMRRNYLRRAAPSPGPADHHSSGYGTTYNENGENGGDAGHSHYHHESTSSHQRPKLFTNNFIEFLTLYGHFAGEELEEDDEALGPDEYFGSQDDSDAHTSDSDHEPMESSALLTPSTRKKRKQKKPRGGSGTNGSWGAVLLLLKSFVGTGVLFLPKAFLNGGMIFSNLVLLFVAILSYYCFVLLVNTRLKVDGSFGDIGGVLYGKWLRTTILGSIVLSQIGFVAAYIVFTSENLQAFILAVTECRTNIDIKYLILMQMAVFLPFSLMRDISKLAFTALIADVLILLGLIYLYYYDFFTIISQGGLADVVAFNKKDWTLFIGTAIFTFEGIGLIIPIQESMKDPRKFPKVLGLVMVIITTIFLSMGALSYGAYGSKTETVVILNMPQDSKLVNAVQLMYSIAILLSTPLQIFPAIRITETELFTRSGKYNPYIKWQKNVFRFFVVALCALIAWGGAADLDKFVALVGSFACVPLVYIYPVSSFCRHLLHKWRPSVLACCARSDIY